MLVDDVELENQCSGGTVAGDRACVVEFGDPDVNDWLAVNQFTVVES